MLMTIYALTDPDSSEGRDVGQTTKNPWTRDHDEARLYDDAYIPCRAAPAPPLHDGRTHRLLPESPALDVTVALAPTRAPDRDFSRCLYPACSRVRQASWIAGRLSVQNVLNVLNVEHVRSA